MGPTIMDLSCENFDHYFYDQLSGMSTESKDNIPKDIVFKLYRRGGDVNTKSTSKLNFLTRLYILCCSFKKRWYLVVEDEEKGLKLNQFNDIRRILKERQPDIDTASDLKNTGGFIFADRELCDAFSCLNRISMSKPYNFLVRAKNAPKNDVTEENKAAEYVTEFLAHYEGTKKEVVSKTGITMPEFLVLLALFPGEETNGADLYKGLFKRSYQSNPGKIRKAFVSLQARGYIRKYGATNGAKLQITALGRDFLRGVMHKYWLNW